MPNYDYFPGFHSDQLVMILFIGNGIILMLTNVSVIYHVILFTTEETYASSLSSCA